MKKFQLVFWCLFISILLSGCSLFKQLVKKPEVEIKNVSFKNIGLFQGTCVFHIQVTNPNPAGARVKNVTYHLKLNNSSFLNNQLGKEIYIPAKSAKTIAVPITIQYLDFYKSLVGFKNSNKILYELSGNIDFGILTLPFSQKGSFDIPKIPSIKLKKIKQRKLSFTKATFDVIVEVENDNPFKVDLKGLDYHIQLAHLNIAQGSTKAIPRLKKNEPIQISIPVTIDFFSFKKSVRKLLKEPSSQYQLTGHMLFDTPKFGEKKIPFNKTGVVSFLKK